LVLHHVGSLSTSDLAEIEHRLRRILGLPAMTIDNLLAEVDLPKQPIGQMQTLAERAIEAVLFHASQGAPDAQPDRLLAFLTGVGQGHNSDSAA